nr:MAG TPA: structural protein [Caudoviricetes sp.]
MKFGSREVANVVFRAKNKMTLGSRTFYKDEPVLYFDTLKTSGLEGAATSVYAQGGWGNPRLIAWEGDKTLTLTMQDALLSPEGLAILSGADLIEAKDGEPIYVHQTSQVEVKTANTIVLPKGVIPCWNGGRKNGEDTSTTDKYVFHKEADIFCMKLDANGEIVGEPCVPAKVTVAGEGAEAVATILCHADGENVTVDLPIGSVVLVDYYVAKKAGFQAEITADKFAGNFYIEGETLFRREADGVDMPAEMVIPNGKVQSNFNLTFSNSGDPAVFDFTVDCFPAYTKFNKTKKVLGLIQVIDEESLSAEEVRAACAVG